ncbi:9573_t:CDS:2, partial [Racocetra fulgida]
LSEAFAQLAKQYGGIVRFHGLLNKPNILISDPKLIQQIMVNHSYDYPRFIFMRAIVKEIIGEGIILANGDSHKRQRKMMNPLFAFANIKEMFPMFVQAGHKLKDIWMKQIDNRKEEKITITTVISKITLDVIGLVGFDYEFNSTTSESELVQAYNSLINVNPPLLYLALLDLFPFIRKVPNPYKAQFINSVKIVKNISNRLVSEQKNTSVQGNNLLSLLVKANEKLPVDEQLTHDELIGQDRLRKEILDVFTDRDHFPTFDEIEHLKYLECTLKETLRIAPPVPVLRRYNVKDEIMDGYVIPKKTPLMIPIYAIHHDPLICGDDAKCFNPSRWLDPEIKSKITNNNFLAFGAGPTNCLGMKMAQLEFKSILSIIIRNFEFRLVEGFTFKMKFADLTKPIPGIDLWVSKVDY